MEQETKDFRNILRDQLEERCARNDRYSLRSFARDLGISAPRLSDVLKGRYGLSREAAKKIGTRLGFSKAESDHFCDLVESKHGRNSQARVVASQRLRETPSKYQKLTLDSFQVVSDWYHLAILELISTEGSHSKPEWIAKQLKISPLVARSAIARLIRLELLTREPSGKLAPTKCFTMSPDGVPSNAIKKFHRAILTKALQAIDAQSIEKRDYSSITLAIDEGQIQEAKSAIRKFRRNFDTQFGGGKKTKVYNLAIQFFSLQEGS